MMKFFEDFGKLMTTTIGIIITICFLIGLMACALWFASWAIMGFLSIIGGLL